MTRRELVQAALALALPRSANPLQWISCDIASDDQRLSWQQSAVPVNTGSLLKPFLLAGYAATHSRFPTLQCFGSRSGCWRVSGHGTQDVTAALANSCNAYFLELASAIDPAALESTCSSYGLSSPSSFEPHHLIGLGMGWPQAPRSVARAFTALSRNFRDTDLRPIFTGLHRCAVSGTAREAAFPCYAKTGTAPCSHLPAGSGDGFTVAIYPLDQPRRVLLLQHHNVPGAVAARDVKALVSLTA